MSENLPAGTASLESDVALTPCSEKVAAFGPASIANLGPGFDVLGLCVGNAGDIVEAWLVEEPGVHLLPSATSKEVPVPLEAKHNTAGVAASVVMQAHSARQGIALRVRKGISIGSGIGGSSASAVAGAWAANLALGQPFEKEELIEAILDGEEVASGSRHGDNVLPALFGGLVIVSPDGTGAYRRVPLPAPLPVAVIVPDVSILTESARAALPRKVSRRDATHTAGSLAFMIDAFRCGDYETVGSYMMTDRIAEPARARRVPCYEAVRRAALEAGAWGCALAGSGPALYAFAPTQKSAETVRQAMLEAGRAAGIEATGFTTQVNHEGVRREKNGA